MVFELRLGCRSCEDLDGPAGGAAHALHDERLQLGPVDRVDHDRDRGRDGLGCGRQLQGSEELDVLLRQHRLAGESAVRLVPARRQVEVAPDQDGGERLDAASARVAREVGVCDREAAVRLAEARLLDHPLRLVEVAGGVRRQGAVGLPHRRAVRSEGHLPHPRPAAALHRQRASLWHHVHRLEESISGSRPGPCGIPRLPPPAPRLGDSLRPRHS
mmetsp:Transcript_1526/g.4830  ORF Transcript_1526/g.4830 Transcript_1526/m.4830 type:complete len:216 (-) Transcript_1526:584-1231(-)